MPAQTHVHDISQNLLARSRLIKACQKDKIARLAAWEQCVRDPKFFFDHFLYTDRNTQFFQEELGIMPFMLFGFQQECVDEIWESIVEGTKAINLRVKPTNVFIEKSRQMGISWILAGLGIYGFIFHNHKYLYVSRKAEEVDKKGDMASMFEKMRFMIRLLPKWMLPPGFDTSDAGENMKYMTISRNDATGSITGESASPNAARGGTYNAIFMDEMAFMRDAGAINKSAASATPCRIFNSTPNGEGNEYHRMRQLAFNDFGVKGLRYHWSEHPFYTKEWYDWKTSSMTREQIAQELEIDYTTAILGRVYPSFRSIDKGGDVEFGQFDFDPSLPTFISIDHSHGGKDPHAITVWQVKGSSLILVDAIQIGRYKEVSGDEKGEDTSYTDCAHMLARRPRPGFVMTDAQMDFYERYKEYFHANPTFIGDPYDSDSKQNDTTIKKEYAKVGIHLALPSIASGVNSSVESRIARVKPHLRRLKVDARRTDFISAISNARYPDEKENSSKVTPTTKPIHDWTSHFRTSMEYAISYITEREELTKSKAPKKRVVEVGNPVTGEISYRTV